MVRGLKDNILLTQCNEFLENFFMGWMMEDKALGVEELSAVALGTSLPFIIWCVCVCFVCVWTLPSFEAQNSERHYELFSLQGLLW